MMPGIRTVLMMAGLLPVISFHMIAPGASAAGAGRQGRTPRISAAAAQPVDVLGSGGGPAGLAAATSLAAVVVVVGATGGTGLRAIRGFLDVGYEPGQLRVLTRSPDKPACLALKGIGVQVVAADLDDSATLAPALRGATSIYCHSTADDTHKLEAAEMERARSLAAAAVACGTVRLLVYNSAAQTNACPRVDQIAQKHQVEAIFRAQTQLPCTVLRASLFMEELWKRHTRPSIVAKGKFPFNVPPTKPIFLTSVRDMGRLAGMCIRAPDKYARRTIDVASDVRTTKQIAAAFGGAQGAAVIPTLPRLLYLLSFVFHRNLYQVIRFYRRSELSVDLLARRREFPALLTPLNDFLHETRWADPSRTYESFAQAPTLDGS
mmetsp:Transcript_16832/g.54814  ORF Transcript_16832/g.54814 Transcript_16832/m.54814 type:complete len:378 (+) Transcript_16832:60-1193(+)